MMSEDRGLSGRFLATVLLWLDQLWVPSLMVGSLDLPTVVLHLPLEGTSRLGAAG